MDAKVVCVFLVPRAAFAKISRTIFKSVQNFKVLIVRVSSGGVASVKRCPCTRKAPTLVNECENSTLNNCDSNATCFDLNIGFACRCNDGFTGNGRFCAEDCNGTPCFGDNRECFRGTSCVCSPGYHNLDGECVEACDTYGDSFIDYQGPELRCVPELRTSLFGDLDACKTACLNETGCISITFDPLTSGIKCFIYGCDPLTTGASLTQFSVDRIVSVRNCA